MTVSVIHKSPHYNKSQLYLKSFNSFFKADKSTQGVCSGLIQPEGAFVNVLHNRRCWLPNNGRQSTPTFLGVYLLEGEREYSCLCEIIVLFQCPSFPLSSTQKSEGKKVYKHLSPIARIVYRSRGKTKLHSLSMGRIMNNLLGKHTRAGQSSLFPGNGLMIDALINVCVEPVH